MPDDLSDEIQTMLGGDELVSDPPASDPPGTDSPETDAPSTDAPSTDALATDAPATDAPTTDAPEEELDEVDALKRQNELLSEQLADLAGRVKLATAAPGTGAPTTDAPAPEAFDFLGDQGVDDVTGDRDMFNALLNEVAKRAVEMAGGTVSETVLRAIPDIVKHNITQHTALRNMADDFYKENADLNPHKKFVGMVGAELASKNPDWNIRRVFSEAAVETRKRIGLKGKAAAKSPAAKPALPGGTGAGKKGAPKSKSGLAGEIDDMMKTVD